MFAISVNGNFYYALEVHVMKITNRKGDKCKSTKGKLRGWPPGDSPNIVTISRSFYDYDEQIIIKEYL